MLSGRACLVSIAVVLATAACSSSSNAPYTVPASPLPVPWHGQVEASPSLATHLLHASDFGAGWYDGFTPVDPTLPSLPAGGRDGAMAMVDKAHRTSQGWVSDIQVWERAVDFDSPAEAHAYVASAIRSDATDSASVPTSSTSLPAGRTTPTNTHAGFVIGSRGYLVLTVFIRHPGPGQSTAYRNPAGARRLVAAAKRRARTGA
jgi:hypothetical protein